MLQEKATAEREKTFEDFVTSIYFFLVFWCVCEREREGEREGNARGRVENGDEDELLLMEVRWYV